MKPPLTEEQLKAFTDRIVEIVRERWDKEFCDCCDYAMPLVPGTKLCADCTSPGFAVGAYRKMKGMPWATP